MDKYKEAIRHFEYTVRALKYLDECPDTPYTKDYIKIRNAKNRRRLQASRLAIEALEKQIPKEPADFDIDFGHFKCGHCGELILITWTSRPSDHKFCLECGQAIDWEGE